jgi:TonB family protein
MNEERSWGVPAHKALARAALVLMFVVPAVHAQSAADGAPSEAARRAAMSPYRFILQNASAPARKPAAETPKRATAAAPDPEPVKQEAVKSAARAPVAAPVAPAAPVTTPLPAAAPVAEPEPVQLAVRATKPPEPRLRREVIPVRTDEPHLSAALLREKPNGVVRVQFDINVDGSTGGVKVLASSNRALNRATTEAVAGWKFEPVDEVLTVETEVAYRYD